MLVRLIFWDEFVNPETGEASGKIELGQSFDFTELIDIAQDMNLPQIAKASMSGGILILNRHMAI